MLTLTLTWLCLAQITPDDFARAKKQLASAGRRLSMLEWVSATTLSTRPDAGREVDARLQRERRALELLSARLGVTQQAPDDLREVREGLFTLKARLVVLESALAVAVPGELRVTGPPTTRLRLTLDGVPLSAAPAGEGSGEHLLIEGALPTGKHTLTAQLDCLPGKPALATRSFVVSVEQPHSLTVVQRGDCGVAFAE